jgi:thiosulfate reductase cytochrome b subunit
MTMSGWAIYNASPLFAFRFPVWATLGGWLGGSVAWHFATMWLLVSNAIVYVGYALWSGHFRRNLLPLRPADILREANLALRLRLPHQAGRYNAVQRLAYVVVLLLGMIAVASGLALWKPVQMSTLAMALGGYEAARRIHFVAMAGIVTFTVIHLVMVMLIPRTLIGMITGRGGVDTAREGAI